MRNKWIDHKDASEFRGDLGPHFEIKELTESGSFEGYGSVFNNVDGGGDIVLPGAFAESLRTRPAGKVKLLWQHDSWQPLGRFTEIYEDSTGLYVKGVLNPEVPQARVALALMRDGAVDGLSIGYRVTADTIDRVSGVRQIKTCDLFEVSIVTFPMNPESTIQRVKGGLPTKRHIESLLTRDAGLTSKEAKALLARGYNALSERDAETSTSTEVLSDLEALTAALRGH